MRNVVIWAGCNLIAVGILFAEVRSGGLLPWLFAASAVASCLALVAISRPSPASFKLGFAALALNSILHFAMYIVNDRLIESGAIPANQRGYLFAVTFTVAILSLGFFTQPDHQRRNAFGPVDAME